MSRGGSYGGNLSDRESPALWKPLHRLGGFKTIAALVVLGATAILGVSLVAKGPEMPSPISSPKPPVVIGIHGLLNKPEKETLEGWWARAIEEGLDRNHNMTLAVRFELAYWADVRNAAPIRVEDLDEPYVGATDPLLRYEPKGIDKIRAVSQKWGGRVLDKEKELFGLGRNVELLLGITVEDLDAYYKDDLIRQQMRSPLIDLLSRHQGERIMLIAHSMGSIIAYDVMRQLEDDGGVNVEHLVTIGSPLGLPIVADKIRREFGATRTPGNVGRWTNLADPGDKVALDCNLADEFTPANGVGVTDVLVHNQYVNLRNNANNHKSYGYLRAPEVSDLIRDFLETQ